MLLNFGLLLQFLLQERALKILELHVDPKNLKIDILAGTDGIWGWIMRGCGLDTKSGYSVDVTGCRRTAHGIISVSRIYAPLYNLSSAVYFLVKPIWALIIGIYFSYLAISGLWGGMNLPQALNLINLIFTAVVGLIAAICLLKFFLGDRTAVIGVMTNAGSLVSIKLKVKPADFRQFQQAIAIIESVVARANGAVFAPNIALSDDLKNEDEDGQDDLQPNDSEDDEDDVSGSSQPARQPKVAGKRVIQCPHCDVTLRINADILGSRIRCPACQVPFVAK